ncbi:MAG: hypothetical protein JWQ09_1131 [Segetibacter sp.]|nr:hypothetical protein [Segetibacter sp.]
MYRSTRRQRMSNYGRSYGRSSASLSSFMPLLIIGGLVLVGKPVLQIVQTLLKSVTSITDGTGNAVSSVTDTLGVTQSQINKEISIIVASPGSPFSPIFYKNVIGAKLITVPSADLMSSKIYDNIGFITYSFSAVFAEFKKLSYQTQVSFLAERFYINYGEDLLTFIYNTSWFHARRRLTDGEILKVKNYVYSLPKGG